VLEWRPSSNSKIYLDGFQTDFKNDFELDFSSACLGSVTRTATWRPSSRARPDEDPGRSRRLHHHQHAGQPGALDHASGRARRSFETDNGLAFSTDFSRTTSAFDFQNPIMDVSTIVPDVFLDTNHDGTVLLRYGGAN